MTLCPCGSEKDYSQCCGPFIEEKRAPQLPEELMRSRYTAFTQANVGYIGRTMREKAALGFRPEEVKEWAQEVTWLGLEVLSAPLPSKHAQTGWVEFIASYKEGVVVKQIHENSQFRRIHGRWYYVAGQHYPQG